MGTRGFVTIAVGSIKYYKLAHNLLLSYRLHTHHLLQYMLMRPMNIYGWL